MKKKEYKFWFKMTVIFTFFWVLTAGINALNPKGTLLTIVLIFAGVAPCCVIDSAILALVANKQEEYEFTQKQKSTNILILILSLMMTIFAQIVTMAENTIPYALPVSLGGLAFYYAVRIVSVKGKKITENMNDSLKVIILGSLATATWAKFFVAAMDLFD